MSVSFPRRFALLLCIAATSFGIFKCTSWRYVHNKEVFCRAGNFSKGRPLICIDEKNLSASPPNAIVWDVEPKSSGMRSSRPVIINWYSQQAADLQITMETPGCTAPVTCDGRGHCSTTVSPQTFAKREQKVCRYGIKLGDKLTDPEDDIVLTPCCY
jgi:hypothetical protein